MISVCMATYNGEKYLKDQLDSILKQIQSSDELIISDDGSNDSTRYIIQEYQKRYANIILVDGPKCGVQKNFEHALKQANGDILFLSDQDDVWKDGKVKRVLREFENPQTLCVVHDCEIVDANLNSTNETFFGLKHGKPGLIVNLYKNAFIGCGMAFRKCVFEKVIHFQTTSKCMIGGLDSLPHVWERRFLFMIRIYCIEDMEITRLRLSIIH